MNVKLTRGAYKELSAILEYLHERSPSGAYVVSLAIDLALASIEEQPLATQVTDYSSIRVKLVAKYPYKIFFRVEKNAIEVVHIRHSARQPWTGV